ncbi:hypothetical protein ACSBR1_029553 [Camellia fascicularis]
MAPSNPTAPSSTFVTSKPSILPSMTSISLQFHLILAPFQSSQSLIFQEINSKERFRNPLGGLIHFGGVTCDWLNGHVIGLDLSCSALHGTIEANSTLFHLRQLQRLNLALNDFKFSRISSEFGLFASLIHLNLSNSLFASRVPSEILRELAEKEPEDGVFKMLSIDVTRFLTTILIGTTVVNIGATALVTKAATTIFGEAGVAVLLLTEITPKSIAVHNATEVARFVVRPVAWLSLILYPVGRVVTCLSMGMLKMLGLKGRTEPYVTEDELKLMLRGAELRGTIEEEEQDMIENVLEIKDTHVREVMTPLVDVVAIDASATLVDFHNLVPVFEQRVDNIVGIAYAMDLLDSVQKGELLESSVVGHMAYKLAYFVPDSMSVWILLREFRIRKVHMAVVLNEYGGTIGIVTLEDVVEEIVGEIFDENDSKVRMKSRKKTGYIVMRADGIYDVDANTSIDQLSKDLNIKMPKHHQYETVSGFICEAFGYIPRIGETIKVMLEKADQEEHDEYTEAKSDRQDEKEKHQNFKLEVSAVRFERVNYDDATLGVKEVTRLFPKIMKRKWSSNEDLDKTDDYDEVPHEKRADDDDLSDDYIINEHENDHDEHPAPSYGEEREKRLNLCPPLDVCIEAGKSLQFSLSLSLVGSFCGVLELLDGNGMEGK